MLFQVQRDGNPLRTHAHVSPFIGKLGPMKVTELRRIARRAECNLPRHRVKRLVVGLTESSLVLAWRLAARLPFETDLRFTSRRRRAWNGVRTFSEPHSHGPTHFIFVDDSIRYDCAVIMEDELTTGATIKNLIRAIADVALSFTVITLGDLRTAEERTRWETDFRDMGIRVSVVDLSSEDGTPVTGLADTPKIGHRVAPNPFGRDANSFAAAVSDLHDLWMRYEPGAVYAIGECVDVPLAFLDSLPLDKQPVFQQITRSPWLVDGRVIHSRTDFRPLSHGAPYFLYNWERPTPARCIVITERHTAWVAAELSNFLHSHGCEVVTLGQSDDD